MEGYRLIDPPVGPFSPPEAIREWIAELERMQPQDAQVAEAAQQAAGWLETAQRRKAEQSSEVGQ